MPESTTDRPTLQRVRSLLLVAAAASVITVATYFMPPGLVPGMSGRAGGIGQIFVIAGLPLAWVAVAVARRRDSVVPASLTAILAFTAALMFMNLAFKTIRLIDGFGWFAEFFTGNLGLLLHMFASLVAVVSVFAALPVLIKHRPTEASRAAAAPPAAAQPVYRELYTADGQKVLVVAPAPSPQTNGLAIASLVLALTGGILLAGLPAIITGHIAQRQIRERGQSGNGLAVAGLVVGYLTLAIAFLLIIVATSV